MKHTRIDEIIVPIVDLLEPTESILVRSGIQSVLIDKLNLFNRLQWLDEPIHSRNGNQFLCICPLDTKRFLGCKDYSLCITRHNLLALPVLFTDAKTQDEIIAKIKQNKIDVPKPQWIGRVDYLYLYYTLIQDDAKTFMTTFEDTRKTMSQYYKVSDTFSYFVPLPGSYFKTAGFEYFPASLIV